jgi:exodeoxyribonuclease V alpha subunit
MSAKTRNGSNLRDQRAPASTPLQTLAGTVERVTFHNADTGIAAIRVKARQA